MFHSVSQPFILTGYMHSLPRYFACMTRDEIIAANDLLRCQFRGGKVLMSSAVCDLDPRLRGRALLRMSMYHSFSDDSLHDWGVFIFAGYTFVWKIDVFAGERSITLFLAEDWFGVPL